MIQYHKTLIGILPTRVHSAPAAAHCRRCAASTLDSAACAPPLHERCRCSEEGSILVFVALAAASVLLLMVLALDSGRVFLARTQLQTAADNAARAAMHAAYDEAVSVKDSRDAARTAAAQVLSSSSVIDGGARLDDNSLQFGLFTFPREGEKQGVFTPQPGGSNLQRPSAVRVRLSRTAQNSTPIRGVGTQMSVVAEATASLHCRQVALVVDQSASFAPSIGQIRKALTDVTNSFANGATRGDTLALVTFSGEGTVLNGSADDSADVDVPLKSVSGANRSEFLSAIDRLQTCDSQACLGTNTAAGIILGRRELETQTSNTCPGDQVLIVVSDGAPCDPKSESNTRTLEAKARTAAKQTHAAGISITSIFVPYPGSGNGNGNSQGTCGSHSLGPAGEEQLMKELAGGPLGKFVTGAQNQLSALLKESIGSFPIVIVD